MDRVDCLVIGAGVVGLACARELARSGLEVVIVERETTIGTAASSRNSEVLHAGLYDAPGSLKATLCVRGRRLLGEFCAAHGVAHRRCGKLVVATQPADEPRLDVVRQRARANGVVGLEPLTGRQALALEPELQCSAALWSPDSGIVDSHGLMLALLGDAQRAGAALAVASRFVGAARRGDSWRVHTEAAGRNASGAAMAGDANGDDATFDVDADWLVNAAGLDAQRVAAAINGFAAANVPRRHLARGHYFSLLGQPGGRSPFSRLIYPTPVDGGLGVHLTLDLDGQARFGPDVEWLASDLTARELNYAVDATRAAAFVDAIRRYWPRLPDAALAPAYSGIRSKLSGPHEQAADFRIDGPSRHGCPGIVHLFGIESPGLTASMAIGEAVTRIVRGMPANDDNATGN